MSTEPETTENAGPGTPDTAAAATEAPVTGPEAARPQAGADPDTDGTDEAVPDGTGPDGTGPDGTGRDETIQDGTDTGPDESSPNGISQDETSPVETDPGEADPGETSQDTSGPDTSGPDESWLGRGEAGDVADAAAPSEARAELAAQRVERERIERRKAQRKGPIESGARLSGKAADLLAAVRAVESGQKPPALVLAEPEGAPVRRRPAPEPVRRPGPVSAGAATAHPGTPRTAPPPQTLQALRRVLSEGGAPDMLALPVATALGEGAEERLRADPWQLLRVTGVRPEQADRFARTLLGAECGPGDARRGRAFAVWLLEQAALAGHTALEAPALVTALTQRGVPDPDSALQDTLAEGDALVFQDALEEPGAPAAPREGEDEAEERPVRVLVGLERYALAEESLADGLARLVGSVPEGNVPADAWERAAASARGSAAELIRAVAGHCLVLHTGGEAARGEPARLLCQARGLGLRAWAATHSPLGRDGFATLLGQQSGRAGEPADEPPAVATVAGLLSGAEGPGRDADGAFDLDLLVVLDAPQLDVETAALLVESLPDGARTVLAGDPSVLWSVGPGRVFADLLAARVCPHVASRVPDPGPLGELVSGIGAGELSQVAAPHKEVVIVPVRDAGEAVHRTVQLVADSVPRAIGVPPEQTVVITPGHGGAAGTRALNSALKERLNPGPGRFGGFDPGDRIAYSPLPGRTLPGHVVNADADGLHLSCSGAPVIVPREQVEGRVRHGWALTAHQAVGGRWPAAVVVLPGDAAQTLSRPWVYTAFGRASRHLSVVQGVAQALPRAVAEVPARPRTTRLPVLLATQVQTPTGAED